MEFFLDKVVPGRIAAIVFRCVTHLWALSIIQHSAILFHKCGHGLVIFFCYRFNVCGFYKQELV